MVYPFEVVQATPLGWQEVLGAQQDGADVGKAHYWCSEEAESCRRVCISPLFQLEPNAFVETRLMFRKPCMIQDQG